MLAGRKCKDLEEEKQKAELWPAKKQVKVECNGEKAQRILQQSRDGVLTPAAHPGPAPAPRKQLQTSKLREKKMLW